jgi:septum formation protein
MSDHSSPGLTLASASPRRGELLRILQFQFDIVPADIDETAVPGLDPARLVIRLARRKAEAVRRLHPDRLIVAADTVVGLDGVILGKPDDAAQAKAMLRGLRGRWHRVWTGLAVAGGHGEPVKVTCVATQVRMRRYTAREVSAYVATGDPMDKAAAYAIQHRCFSPVAEIRGCRANVMGLPVCVLAGLLRQIGHRCGDPRVACASQLGIRCDVSLPRSTGARANWPIAPARHGKVATFEPGPDKEV